MILASVLRRCVNLECTANKHDISTQYSEGEQLGQLTWCSEDVISALFWNKCLIHCTSNPTVQCWCNWPFLPTFPSVAGGTFNPASLWSRRNSKQWWQVCRCTVNTNIPSWSNLNGIPIQPLLGPGGGGWTCPRKHTEMDCAAAATYIQWNLYIVDTLGPAIFVLTREVSAIKRFKNVLALWQSVHSFLGMCPQ